MLEEDGVVLLVQLFGNRGVTIFVCHLEMVAAREIEIGGHLDGIEQVIFIVEDGTQLVVDGRLGTTVATIVSGELLVVEQYADPTLLDPFLAYKEDRLPGREVDGLDGLLLFLPVNVLDIGEDIAHMNGLSVGELQTGIIH